MSDVLSCMSLQQFIQQAVERPPGGRYEVQDLVAIGFRFQGALNGLHLARETLDTFNQFIFVIGQMRHRIPPLGI